MIKPLLPDWTGQENQQLVEQAIAWTGKSPAAQPTAVVESKLICLVLTSPDGGSATQTLDLDASLIVGSDERCGMHISHKSISPRHCTIRVVSGEIVLTDWFSECGTFINGLRISEETRLQREDQVRLGECDLKIVMRELSSRSSGERAKPNPNPIAGRDPETAVTISSWKDDSAILESPNESDSELGDHAVERGSDLRSSTRLQIELAQAQEEIEFLRRELEAELAKPAKEPSANSDGQSSDSPELELLRAQNVQLQMELAEREAALLSGWTQDDQQGEANAQDGMGETDVLIERLEQMLDELKAADRRVATMDDLLRSAAEEHRLEIEEREQLTNWVAEIEQRISEREDSWRAERTQLEAKVAELTAQRKQEAAALSTSVAAQAGDQAGRALAELQRKYDRAIDQLEAQQTEFKKLKQAAEKSREGADKAKRVHELEALLKQRDVEMSQERAAMARQRADWDRARVEAERSPRSLDKADDNDIRIQAFRDHLRGIHEQELNQQKELKSRSLATRLAQLWQRLDGG